MTDGALHDRRTAPTDKGALLDSIDMFIGLTEDSRMSDLRVTLAALGEKLIGSRFNLAVLGQMKRGKSTFINALLGADILPTGVLPLTSVITRVRFGDRAGAQIRFKNGAIESIPLGSLAEYITEAANPGNRRQVASADVSFSSPFLKMGIDLIDTPGIGSTHVHNTSTTEEYISQIDAGIVILSVDPPITEVESDFLRRLRHDIPRLLFVVNKIDMATPGEVSALVSFLESELRNRIGIASPEFFPLSARLALHERQNGRGGTPSEMEPLASRLRQFAVEEKEQVLLQSVALDLQRIASTLRFAFGVGERARTLTGEELASKKAALDVALARTDQELKDLHHLLRQDTGAIIARIEKDLKEHIEAATPGVHARLTEYERKHPSETRDQLGRLLDQFMLREVENVFEDWRMREDEEIRRELSSLCDRFSERTNQILLSLQKTAGSLFDVPVNRVNFRSSLSVDSRLYYHTEPVFKYLLDKFIFVLPKPLLRRVIFRRMLHFIDVELSRNAGRIRYDYLERLEKSVLVFEKELRAAVTVVVDNLRFAIKPETEGAESATAAIGRLDLVIALCSRLLDPAIPSAHAVTVAGG